MCWVREAKVDRSPFLDDANHDLPGPVISVGLPGPGPLRAVIAAKDLPGSTPDSTYQDSGYERVWLDL